MRFGLHRSSFINVTDLYHSVQNRLPSRLLSKKVKIRMYKAGICLWYCMGVKFGLWHQRYKSKAIPVQAVVALRVVRGWGSHNLETFGPQMVARLSALHAGRFLPPGKFLVLISVRGWVDPRAMVRLEGLGKLKKSTSSGIRTGDLPACSIVPQPIST
jgi:hypothetical protein